MSAVRTAAAITADRTSTGTARKAWEIAPDRRSEWIARGHRSRDFFAHRVVRLPKCGPDGFQLARRMAGIDVPDAMWELVLYAEPDVVAPFPPDLFFDDDVVWHQQQFGVPGQVATASLAVSGSTVHAFTYVADVVQRIPRRREHKTQVERRLKGWAHLLVNAVVCFAADRGSDTVRSAGAALARRHTDRSRDPAPEMFERIYDRTLAEGFGARRDGEWWVLDVAASAPRALAPAERVERPPFRRTVAIVHDVERGRGHLDVDRSFARRAERESRRSLEAMLEIEARLGVRATYCVVGELVGELRGAIEGGGHCLAFHSHDHRLDTDQLQRCREVDYRLKGYRPPRSVITAELSDRNLLERNFEWLASSPRSLGVTAPELRAGLVRLPVGLDDHPMHAAGVRFADWRQAALEHAGGSGFAAIGLHDCYAPHWLDDYAELLERLGELGDLRTLDEVAADTTLASAT